MTTVAELERLKALVDRLIPLSSRARGEVIAAEDWNTVVGALLEVARSAVVSGADRAAPPHDHPDQVRIGWLEPRLRAMIERGPLDDPVAVARVGAVERAVSAADGRLDRLAEELREVREAASRLEVADLAREATMTRLARTVDGLGDARDDVGALRDTLDSLRTQLATVSTFATGWGTTTPATLLERLAAVEQLRERLTTADGSLLDAIAFERRLAELSTTLVTEEELTGAIGNLRLELPDDQRAALLEQAQTAAQRQSEQSTAALGEQLRDQIASRLAAAEAAATSAVTALAGQLRDSLRTELSDSLRQELVGVVNAGDDALRTELNEAVAAATATLQGAIETRVAEFQATVAYQVGTAVERLRPDLTASISANLSGLVTDVTARVGAVEATVSQLNQALTANATDLAALRQTTATALVKLSTDLYAALDSGLRTVVNNLTAAQSQLYDTLRGELAAQRQQLDLALNQIQLEIQPFVGKTLVTRQELNAALTASNDRLRTELLAAQPTRTTIAVDPMRLLRPGG